MTVAKLPIALQDRAYNKVVYWVLYAGLICFAAVVLYDYGYLGYLFAADRSRISYVIVGLFVAFSAYCIAMIVMLSHEFRLAEAISARLADGEKIRLSRETARVGDLELPPQRLVTEHIVDLLLKRARDEEAAQGELLASFISQLRSRTRFGIYGSDVLYKLGMLGTVIGFIQMLTVMDGLAEFDAETLRVSLQAMMGGMATALLTTIAGLVCGLLLRVQFNMLEALSADLVKRVVRIGDIYVVPHGKASADVRS